LFSEEKVVIKSALADRAASPSPDPPCCPVRSLVATTPPNPRHA
jgi:hypothetical protein